MELGFGGIDREWCMDLCGSQRVVVAMVVQIAMGAMILDQFGRGFGGAACFRMWCIIQLRQYEFASGAEVVQRSFVGAG